MASDFEVLDPAKSSLWDLVGRYAGSKALRDVEELNTLALRGEAGGVALKGILKPELKAIQSLKAGDRATLSRLFEELRDGAQSATREFYTVDEFAEAWKRHSKTGLEPTQKQTDAYVALMDVSNASWIMEASQALGKYVRSGYKNIKIGEDAFAPARKIDNPLDEDLAKLSNEDALAVRSGNKSMWQLEKALDDGTEFILSPDEVRILQYEDVLGFNAGGRRSNSPANFFVMLTKKAGEALRPKAMLTAFTHAKALKASEELGLITKATREGNLTDEIVATNNTWNPAVETVEDLQALAKENGWDLTRDVEFKGRDLPITSIDETNPFFKDTHEAFFRNDNRRGDTPLMEFGGHAVTNADPVQAIMEMYGTASQRLAMRAHTVRSVNSWLEKASTMAGIKLDTNLASSPLMQFKALSSADFVGTGPDVRRMQELHKITKDRLNLKSDIDLAMDRLGTQTADFVDKRFGKQMKETNIQGSMLKFGFHSRLGFFNSSQVIMQAFHATSIIAIAPKYGMVGAGRTLVMRQILNSTDLVVQKEAIKRFAKFAKMELSEAEELVEYIKTSGRSIIDADQIEIGTGVDSGVSGFMGDSFLASARNKASKVAGKTLELGKIPFNAGERLSRMTAINTAFAEFKALHPTKSALDEFGRDWITKREQTLSFNMTTQSRPQFQSGILRVPTQWMSYSFRAMEAVTFGTGGLTGKERRRLFTVLGPVYGLSAFGMESGTEFITEKLGVAHDHPSAKLIRFGILDYMLTQVGLDTAVSPRLAPFRMLTDIKRKLQDDTLLETALGPSGEIIGDAFSAATSVFSSLTSGDTSFLADDIIKVLRQPSGVDIAFKVHGMLTSGMLINKNGKVSITNVETNEIIQQGLGFTPARAVEISQNIHTAYLDDKDFKTARKEINSKADIALRNLTSENGDERQVGLQQIRAINIMIDRMWPFSYKQKNELRDGVLRASEPAYLKLYRMYVKQGNLDAARRALNLGENK